MIIYLFFFFRAKLRLNKTLRSWIKTLSLSRHLAAAQQQHRMLFSQDLFSHGSDIHHAFINCWRISHNKAANFRLALLIKRNRSPSDFKQDRTFPSIGSRCSWKLDSDSYHYSGNSSQLGCTYPHCVGRIGPRETNTWHC